MRQASLKFLVAAASSLKEKVRATAPGMLLVCALAGAERGTSFFLALKQGKQLAIVQLDTGLASFCQICVSTRTIVVLHFQ